MIRSSLLDIRDLLKTNQDVLDKVARRSAILRKSHPAVTVPNSIRDMPIDDIASVNSEVTSTGFDRRALDHQLKRLSSSASHPRQPLTRSGVTSVQNIPTASSEALPASDLLEDARKALLEAQQKFTVISGDLERKSTELSRVKAESAARDKELAHAFKNLTQATLAKHQQALIGEKRKLEQVSSELSRIVREKSEIVEKDKIQTEKMREVRIIAEEMQKEYAAAAIERGKTLKRLDDAKNRYNDTAKQLNDAQQNLALAKEDLGRSHRINLDLQKQIDIHRHDNRRQTEELDQCKLISTKLEKDNSALKERNQSMEATLASYRKQFEIMDYLRRQLNDAHHTLTKVNEKSED